MKFIKKILFLLVLIIPSSDFINLAAELDLENTNNEIVNNTSNLDNNKEAIINTNDNQELKSESEKNNPQTIISDNQVNNEISNEPKINISSDDIQTNQETNNITNNDQTLLDATTYNVDSMINQVQVSAHWAYRGWNTEPINGEHSSLGLNNPNGIDQLEAIKIIAPDFGKGPVFKYCGQVENRGWQNYINENQVLGFPGHNLRLETVKFQLNDNYKNDFDFYYRVRLRDYGWLDWTNNDSPSGSINFSEPIINIDFKLLPKNTLNLLRANAVSYLDLPYVNYKAHIQNLGWQSTSNIVGSLGQGLRLEAMSAQITSHISGGIRYQSHIQDRGWDSTRYNGEMTGSTGSSLRLEAISMALGGDLQKYFNLYYRTHIQNYGWLGFKEAGNVAGSAGISYRMEAIEVKIVPKHLSLQIPLGHGYVIKPALSSPPYYSQHDRRWANRYFGRWNMSASGCVPTAISMALSAYCNRPITPEEIGSYLYYNTNEFNKIMAGASGYAFKLAASNYGVAPMGLNTLGEFEQQLRNGNMVMAMVDSRSPFIKGGTHAVVCYGYSNGKTYVRDPNNASKNGWYSTYALFNNWRSFDPYDMRAGHDFVAFLYNPYGD